MRIKTVTATKEVMMTSGYVQIEQCGKVMLVTLNWPEVYDAVHETMHHETANIRDDFAEDTNLWVAV